MKHNNGKEVEEIRQALARSLKNPERKLVLHIINNNNLIAGVHANVRPTFDFVEVDMNSTPTPQMGDNPVVNGQNQVFFLPHAPKGA